MSCVLIYSKSTLYKECLANFIKGFEPVDKVVSTSDLSEMDQLIDKFRPDFVVADVYSRNNGQDIMTFVSGLIPEDRIIILTTNYNKHLNYYESVYGITKFVFADDSYEEISDAFGRIFSGSKVDFYLKESSILTPRECEILKLIATGMTSKEIADMLCISKNTVDTHRNKMLQKLNIANSASLVQFAYSSGLL